MKNTENKPFEVAFYAKIFGLDMDDNRKLFSSGKSDFNIDI